MAALWWTKQLRDLNPNSSVAEYKHFIANAMMQSGYVNVRVTDSDVSGEKGGGIVAVCYLEVVATRFWEVIAGSGNTGQDAQFLVNEVRSIAGSIV